MVERIWRVAYFQREQISFGSAVLISVIALFALIQPVKKAETVTISEMTAFLEREPSPEPAPQPVPEIKPQPVQKQVIKNVVPIDKATPHQEVARQQEVTERAVQFPESPHKQAESISAAPAASPVKTEAPVKSEVPAKPEVQQPSANAKYESYVLAYLEKAKRYPTSREARQTRPQGMVKIWLEINRAGELVGYGIVQPSSSNLLDTEALKVAKFGEFPPFPDGVYPNESTHRFIASLKYEVN